jgi:16S rRNA (guanine527-N7)-methyltransferase
VTAHLPVLPDNLGQWQQTLHWQPDPQQQRLFQQIYTAILDANQQLNLTSIIQPLEFWEKHLWDSLSGISEFLHPSILLPKAKVIDIGTGAGFPGLPAAIVRPDWQLTLLDSTQKKITFLEQLQQALTLSNVKTLAARSEQVGQLPHHRETYDLALIRAVGSASVCAEYALPLLKLNGLAILYRGQWSELETQALNPAIERLGGHLERIQSIATPLTSSCRHLLYLRKVKDTPTGFPRPIGVPSKQPL